MPLPEDWRGFIESLNSAGVEYLVVGAVALAHHGFPPTPGIWISSYGTPRGTHAGWSGRLRFLDLPASA